LVNSQLFSTVTLALLRYVSESQTFTHDTEHLRGLLLMSVTEDNTILKFIIHENCDLVFQNGSVGNFSIIGGIYDTF